jgi:EAL domain-containing protein (putative c-di-GMP-specific phosphodiesterase class I)
MLVSPSGPMPSPFEHHVFPPGTPIFREGEPGDCAYVIERGSVEISSLRAGRSVRFALLGESELFGEMALVDGEVRSATATALEETEVVILTQERVHKELGRADPLLHLLLRVTLDRLRSTNERVSAPPGAVVGESVHVGSSSNGREYGALRDLRDQAIRRIKLEQELGKALGDGSLALRYQPIVSLPDRSITGFEALIRWHHPERGLLPPSSFVPLAEESGLIVPIGRRVLETACEMAVQWQRFAPPGEAITMAVNVSGCQLAARELIDHVRIALARSGLPADRLLLEMTETVMVRDAANVAQQLRELRQLGVRLAIDDFGTGYSSLSYLHRFPVDQVKLDKSFVDSINSDGEGSPIARAVINMAHALGISVTAEGVETIEQARGLQVLGCERAQGFLFGRPVPAIEFSALLRKKPRFVTLPEGVTAA